MRKTQRTLFPILLFAILALAACNYPTMQSTSVPQSSDALHTAAAQTIMAQLTQMAQGTLPVISTGTPQSGGIPGIDTQQPALATVTPTESDLPTVTSAPQATSTPKASPTPTPIPCNAAEFVKDVSVPDGTEFNPGVYFTKTWRLKNVGTCTWTQQYAAVLVSGESMGGDTTPLPKEVKPGDTVDISVNMVAPMTVGTYKGNWFLEDASSDRFGLGEDGSKPFWVEIKVVEPAQASVFNLVENYCSAHWESSAGDLKCPGNGDEATGFVVRIENPNLENRKENEPALYTFPEMVTDGWIRGTYPVYKIKAGDRFLADVGCLANNPQCDVVFQLSYRTNDPTPKPLGEWREVYDGKITRIDIDLTPLAGQNVQFILTVLANGSPNQDAAFWLQPHIAR